LSPAAVNAQKQNILSGHQLPKGKSLSNAKESLQIVRIKWGQFGGI
jgi:hypothetical protein